MHAAQFSKKSHSPAHSERTPEYVLKGYSQGVYASQHCMFYLFYFFYLPSLEGLSSSSKTSSYPVRMENGVPVVQQSQNTQSLQIQPGMLTQVSLCVCVCVCVAVCQQVD